MRFIAAAALAAFLSACGGGGSSVEAPEDASTPTPQPEVVLTEYAPLDNLDLAQSAAYLATAGSTHCGYPVPSKSITGIVSSVHDGDTIKIGSVTVRLDSIDAPELRQTYGTQSRDNLANIALGKQVTVYYAKVDKYGRTVGSVFTNTCQYANLQQVLAGAAWHYKQYQCEQPASLRSEFAAAQSAAEAADRGLWAFAATPPWVYRNGAEVTAPTCTSENPVWYAEPVAPVTPPINTGSSSTAPTYTPTTSGCYMVWVNGYRRANGTWVSGYYRRSPGCA